MDTRGMNYAKMAEFVSDNGPIKKFRIEVENYFLNLRTNYVEKVKSVYGGDAANTFNEKLQAASKEMNGLLDSILEEFSTKVSVKSQQQSEQELRMKNSVE